MLAQAIGTTMERYVPVDFRAVILDKMKKLEITPNGLHGMVKPHIARAAIYTFLAGKSDMLSANVARILEALELEEKRRK